MVELGIRYLFQAQGEIEIKDDNGFGEPLMMTNPYMEVRFLPKIDTRLDVINIECHFWEVTGKVALTFSIPNSDPLDITKTEVATWVANHPFLGQFINIPVADIQTHIDARLLLQGKNPDGTPIVEQTD